MMVIGILRQFRERKFLHNDLMRRQSIFIFLQMLKRQSFDDDKLNFLAPQLNSTSFTSNQIKLTMKEFSFDKNRLEFAKELIKTVSTKKLLP